MSRVITPGDAAAGALWSGAAFRGPWRKAARARFVEAVSGDFEGQAEWHEAAARLQDWLDTWPLAGLVDEAHGRWLEVQDATALTVLGRAAEVMTAAAGWDCAAIGPWPAVPQEWLSEQGLPAPADTTTVPAALLEIPADTLASARSELARSVAHGEYVAVAVQGDVPQDPASRLALGELRMEASRQEAWEAFGAVGLRASDTPPAWGSLLGSAPSGHESPTPSRCCEAVFAPGPVAAVRRGELDDVGYLLWEGPYEAIAVQREAIVVARALDGTRDAAEVAAAARLPHDFVAAVMSELTRIGAVSGDK